MKKPSTKLLSGLLIGLSAGLMALYTINRALQPAAPPLPPKGAAVKVTEVKEPTPNKPALSSLAPEAKMVKVSADEGPHRRFERLQLDPPPQKKLPVVVAEVGIDPKHPPQWTRPLALASAQVTPPDPFTEPAMAVNPERQPPADGPRYSPGEFKEVP